MSPVIDARTANVDCCIGAVETIPATFENGEGLWWGGCRRENRCLILVPAFNEAESIEATLLELAGLPESQFCILVVDDGSTDGTSEIAARVIQRTGRGRVERTARNRGVGNAFARAIGQAASAEEYYDSVVQFDADGQHRVCDLQKLVERRRADQVDLLIGSRYAVESPVTRGGPAEAPVECDRIALREPTLPHLGESLWASTPARRLGGWLLGWAIWQRTGQRVTDPTSGLRCFGWSVACDLAKDYPDGVSEPVALAWALRRGLAVMEEPVTMRPRTRGRSSLDWRRIVPFMLRSLWGIWTTPRATPRGRGHVVPDAASPEPCALRLGVAQEG